MVRKHARSVFCLAALLCLGRALPARAATFAGSGAGTTGADFLRLPVGARPAGLAEAFTGFADDVHSLAYNPAGIAFLSRQEFGMVYDAYAPGVNHGWTGYIHPMRFGTYGLSVNMLSVAPFDSYTIYDQADGQTSAMDSAYQLSYGLRISNSWADGGSAKYVTSRLHTEKASTAAGDISTLWIPLRGLRLGMAVLNFGNGLTYDSVTSPLPVTGRIGASWTPYDPRDFRHYFTFTVDGSETRGEKTVVSGGVELWYEGVLALRAGGRSDPGLGPGYTAGIGIYLFRDEHRPCEIGFDYAFVDSGDLTQTHRASLVFKFGRTLREERRGTLIEWQRARDQTAPSKQRQRARQPSASSEEQTLQPLPDSETILSPDYKKWTRP